MKPFIRVTLSLVFIVLLFNRCSQARNYSGKFEEDIKGQKISVRLYDAKGSACMLQIANITDSDLSIASIEQAIWYKNSGKKEWAPNFVPSLPSRKAFAMILDLTDAQMSKEEKEKEYMEKVQITVTFKDTRNKESFLISQ